MKLYSWGPQHQQPDKNIVKHLSSDDVICEHGNCRRIANKVRYGFHDVPRILPPRQSRHEAKLSAHKAQAHPGQQSSSLLSSSLHFYFDLQRGKIPQTYSTCTLR